MMMAPIDRTRCMPPVPPKPTAKPKHDFKKMDSDKNGTVNRDEFIRNGNEGPIGWATQRIRSAQFDQLDKNKDGQLSKLEQFFANMSKPVKPIFPGFPKPELPKFDTIREKFFA